MRPLLIALQFLTRLPLRIEPAPQPQEIGRSLLAYPLVGLSIGAVLCGLDSLLQTQPGPLRAALLLSAWVLVSGALHLDGLADCADAWIGGQGEATRSLAIMKDPCAGPVAVVVLVLTLLLKFAALAAGPAWPALLLAPALGRAAAAALFLGTPYLRREGLGSAMARHAPRRSLSAVLVALGLLSLVLSPLALLTATASFLGLRQLALRRLGGFTGDVAGATVELVELAVLLGHYGGLYGDTLPIT